jgi:ABC-type Fe3+ transport system permease subunit
MLILLATAWTLPGPVLGLGLKAAFQFLSRLSGGGFVESLLETGPSALPVLWVDLVRFTPFAAAVLWPTVRRLPQELFDAAAVDGAGPWRQLTHVAFPLSAAACLRAGLAAGVLSLGEISAGKLVSTTGFKTYAEQIFTQMHYGVTAALAAQCLLLLAAVVAVAALLMPLRGDTSQSDP